MTSEELEKANQIKDEIKELEFFISCAERRWTGTLIQRNYIFKANSFGGLGSKELHLKTDLKNKLLDVLEEELKELKRQLEAM